MFGLFKHKQEIKPDPANDTGAKPATAIEIGDRMADGTVYAGNSPDTNKPMYATPAVAPLTYNFNRARKYAAQLDAHGHRDWRVPTKGELNVLFQNRAAIGGFDESGSDPAGWYKSSTRNDFDDDDERDFTNTFAWDQRFSDGTQFCVDTLTGGSLRCVR